MKNLFVSMLLLLLIVQPALAVEPDPVAICKAMTQYLEEKRETINSNPSFQDFLLSGAPHFKIDRKLLRHTDVAVKAYENILGDMYNNKSPEAILINCLDQFGVPREQNIKKTADQIANAFGLGATATMGHELYAKVPASNKNFEEFWPGLESKSRCESKLVTKEDMAECNFITPVLSLPKGFRDFMNFEENKLAKASTKYTMEECSCIKRNFKKENKNQTIVESQARIDEMRLHSIVSKALGMRVLNEYAALSEDLQYYATINAWVMKEGSSKKVEPKQLCQEPADFLTAIKNLCNNNGTTEGSEERLAALMGTFNKDLSKKSFESGLKALVSDINTFTIDTRKVTKGDPNILTRSSYDKARHAISQEEPQVQIANDIVTIMLSDTGGMKQVLLDHVAQGKSPLYGVMDILSGNKPEHVDFIISKLEQFYPANHKAFKEFKTNKGKDVLRDNVDKMFHVALNLHPGFKNLMNDPELFKNIAGMVKSDLQEENDVLALMNNDKKLFNAHMDRRCSKVQQHFAEAVCAKPQDIQEKIGPNELQALARQDKDFKFLSEDSKDMLMCRTNSFMSGSDPFYAKLTDTALNPYETSDYLDRQLHPDDQKNGLAQMAHKISTDKKYVSKLNEATEKYSYARVSSGASKTVPTDVLSAKSQNSSEAVASVNNVEGPQPSRAAVAQNVLDQTNKAIAQATATHNVVTPYVAPQVASEKVADEKKTEEVAKTSYDRLSKELSSTDDKSKVSNHMNNISEADAQEILRLRDQAMKDKQTISEYRVREEQAKADALKKEYEQLQSRFDNFEKSADRSPGSINSDLGRASVKSGPQFEAQSMIAPQAVTNTASTGGGFSGTSLTSGSAGSGSMLAPSESSSNATGATTAASKESNDARLSMNLVVATNVSDIAGASSEDPSAVLINYLTKNEPTAAQLQELKSSGLLYTEEDLSVDGKKIQTKKLVKFDKLSPEAKVLIEKKLASMRVQEVKRNYSRQALLLELFTISLKKNSHSVKNEAPLKL